VVSLEGRPNSGGVIILPRSGKHGVIGVIGVIGSAVNGLVLPQSRKTGVIGVIRRYSFSNILRNKNWLVFVTEMRPFHKQPFL
jgi:hypothetical protein